MFYTVFLYYKLFSCFTILFGILLLILLLFAELLIVLFVVLLVVSFGATALFADTLFAWFSLLFDDVIAVLFITMMLISLPDLYFKDNVFPCASFAKYESSFWSEFKLYPAALHLSMYSAKSAFVVFWIVSWSSFWFDLPTIPDFDFISGIVFASSVLGHFISGFLLGEITYIFNVFLCHMLQNFLILIFHQYWNFFYIVLCILHNLLV